MNRMPGVSENVRQHFDTRLVKVLNLIKDYNINFEEVGVFGSYARGDYTGLSDIDLCIITANRPDRRTSGSLREDADMLRADIIYVTRNYFNNDSSRFAMNLRRDYKKVL